MNSDRKLILEKVNADFNLSLDSYVIELLDLPRKTIFRSSKGINNFPNQLMFGRKDNIIEKKMIIKEHIKI